MNSETEHAIRDRTTASDTRAGFAKRWENLIGEYLPVFSDESAWRFSRETTSDDPSQGWKLHISATVLDACDVFEKVAQVLSEKDFQFKAPRSLDELVRINCGLYYGYHQVGKFITVYPKTPFAALEIAETLHNLTKSFVPVSVPFDNQYSPESSVFYRYGAFRRIEYEDDDGVTVPSIIHPDGTPVPDDRFRAVPAWLENPFPESRGCENVEPLSESYRIFNALTQRGKGGTYLAFDMSSAEPRFCVVKEGRRNGELSWNGQDGYWLVKNEAQALKQIREDLEIVPDVYGTFEVEGNVYVAMEYLDGKSLFEAMRFRRRRYSIRRVLELSLQIAEILVQIDAIGWVWNDCKPANLIATRKGPLRPIDFEGAYRKGGTSLFDWNSVAFSRQNDEGSRTCSDDIFSFGAVIFYLLTGKLYDSEEPEKIDTLRRNVPSALRNLIEGLTKQDEGKRRITPNEVKAELETIYSTI